MLRRTPAPGSPCSSESVELCRFYPRPLSRLALPPLAPTLTCMPHPAPDPPEGLNGQSKARKGRPTTRRSTPLGILRGCMTVLAIFAGQIASRKPVARASRPCVPRASPACAGASSCPRFEGARALDTKGQGRGVPNAKYRVGEPQDSLATRPRKNGHAPSCG